MNMKRPEISVVLCTYNGEKFVAQQIESILNQSIPPDELIISDDCSTDATVDIVSDFLRKYSTTVRIFQNNKNIGFIENFAKAINLSEGGVVCLSDQDDVWFERKIEYMLQPFIDREDVGLVYSDAITTNSELEPTEHTLFGKRKSMMLEGVRTAPILIKGVGINGCTMAFRSTLKEYVLPIGQGWGHDHWIAFIAHAITDVTPVSQPLMYYRRHGDSAGNDSFLEGGYVKRWRAGINTVHMDDYESDLCRWESMLHRLYIIKEKKNSTWVNYSNLDVFIYECERRTDLARLRIRMKKKRRLYRFPNAFRILSSGYYHQYLRGMKSLAKDLLIR